MLPLFLFKLTRFKWLRTVQKSYRQLTRISLITTLAGMTFFAGTGPLSAIAASSPSAHPDLTLSVLKQRITTPIRQGGATLIDLKGFTIDLRSDPVDFSEPFYQQLQAALNPKKPNDSRHIGLDLSGALIQGDLQLGRLAQRIPAYGDAILPELQTFKDTFEPLPAQSFLPPPYRSSSSRRLYTRPYAKRLSRFLLPSVSTSQPDMRIFQGPLLLNQTCFNGLLNASSLYFLNRVSAQAAIFTQKAQWQATKFAQSALFNESQFQQDSSFRGALFAGRTRFNQALFNGPSDWQGAHFYSSSFAQADFQMVTFARTQWQANADFERAKFHESASFQKSRFDQGLFLTEAVLEGPINFRQGQFQRSLSLRAAHILSQVDFGDARFANTEPKPVTINVTDLDFSAGEARILGSPGQIGSRFSVPTLTSNETVLRNLVRNFRLLEQIGDANQLEFTLEQLRLSQIKRQMLGTSLNEATQNRLVNIGFTPEQAIAVHKQAEDQAFVSRSDLLMIDEIDLATYLQVRDRITTKPTHPINRLQHLLQWLVLASLLRLSSYGTSVGLIFSVGILALSLFALMFWLVDRYRRLMPTPIVPTRRESIAMGLTGGSLLLLGLSLLTQSTAQPGATLATVGLLTLPIPAILIAKLYQGGRYHDLMDRSYFVENGALRKLQVLIARLPVPPKFPFYRERYTPLMSDRNWNWLNYFDFSLNNWFKFGFNDIRLRDKCVPGLVSALVWYQWSLGVAYITLLLWTLSRTIPGLNLLLYF